MYPNKGREGPGRRSYRIYGVYGIIGNLLRLIAMEAGWEGLLSGSRIGGDTLIVLGIARYHVEAAPPTHRPHVGGAANRGKKGGLGIFATD